MGGTAGDPQSLSRQEAALEKAGVLLAASNAAAVRLADCVDLTPYVREDILLEFPRHPLCNSECRGLPSTSLGKARNAGDSGKNNAGSPAWAELNKLKF